MRSGGNGGIRIVKDVTLGVLRTVVTPLGREVTLGEFRVGGGYGWERTVGVSDGGEVWLEVRRSN